MSYAPPGESASNLWLERSYFDGLFIGGVFYGIHLTLFSTIVYVMTRKTTTGNKSRFFLGYAFVLFALGTISIAAAQKFGEMAWIDDRNYPGGPSEWVTQQFANPMNSLSNASFVVAVLLSDGLFLYRLWIIWNHNYYVVVFPSLIYLASAGLSIMTIFQTSQPGKNATSKTTVSSAVPYGVISIVLNVLLTAMIAFRLLSLRKTVKAVLGEEQAKPYTSITAMVVESSSLYTITALIFIICYVSNSNIANLVFNVGTQVVCISPELIILRVAHGLAWSGEATRHQAEGNMTQMSFKPGITPPSMPTMFTDSFEETDDADDISVTSTRSRRESTTVEGTLAEAV